jgi:hypothetical protein
MNVKWKLHFKKSVYVYEIKYFLRSWQLLYYSVNSTDFPEPEGLLPRLQDYTNIMQCAPFQPDSEDPP